MQVKLGEFMPDQSDRHGQACEALNVFPTAQGYRQFPSLQPVSDPLDGIPSGAIFCRDRDGNVTAYAGTYSKLYELDKVVTDRTKDGGYTTDLGDSWEFVQWSNQTEDRVIATNYTDPVQYKDLGGDSDFDDLPNAPKAAHAATVRDFLVLGNTNDNVDGVRGNRVFWSGFNDVEHWTVGENQCDFQDLRGNGGFVQRIFGGEFGVVFQERAIWRMQYVGSPVIWQFDEVERGKGTPLPRSCVQFGRSIFYIGRDGFYELVDGSYSNPIGSEKVDRFFVQDFDTDYAATLSATVDPLRSVVIWNYAGAGHENGIPNKALIYNWKTQRWSRAEFSTSLVFFGATLSYTLEELDEFGDLETLPFSLDSRVWKRGNEFLAGFDTEFRFGFFDGPPMDAVIDTQEINGDTRMQMKALRPFVQGTPATVVTAGVGARNQLTEDVTYTALRPVDATGKVNVRTNARYQRVRLHISGGFEHVEDIDIEMSKRGRR